MKLPQRKNHRLKNYDYTSYGYYFVTICTNHFKMTLSKITDNSFEVVPTIIGEQVVKSWYKIEELYNAEIISFVLMPNHIHGVVKLNNKSLQSVSNKKYRFESANDSLSKIIGDFKSVTTRKYKEIYGVDESLWQKSFYDEIITSDEHYFNVLQYINENPRIWKEDKYFYESYLKM